MKFPKLFETIVNPKPIAVIVGCIDPRFKRAMDGFPHEILGLDEDEFIFIKIGGGPATLAHPTVAKSRCKGLTKQLIFTCQKFPISDVILISHGNCAYYSQFPCPRHGPEVEKKDLPLAGSLVQKALPNQEIKLYHADFLNGDKHIGFEEIQVSKEIRIPPADWIKEPQHQHQFS